MQMITAWKDSLSLLIPKTFKRFMLVTLNTIVQTSALWFRYWFWLLPVVYISASCGSLWWRLDIWVEAILLISFVLVVRPSVDRKDSSYFIKKITKTWLAFYVLLYAVTVYAWHVFLVDYAWSPLSCGVCIAVWQMFVFYVLAVWYLLSLLFFLDSRGSLCDVIASCMRSLKMMLYTLPLLLVTWIILAAIVLPVVLVYHAWIAPFVYACASVCLFIQMLVHYAFYGLVISYITNVYVKRVHEQYTLYFS